MNRLQKAAILAEGDTFLFFADVGELPEESAGLFVVAANAVKSGSD